MQVKFDIFWTKYDHLIEVLLGCRQFENRHILKL